MRGFFKLSFKQLMLANIFLGSRKENFYAFMRPFILGYRTSFCILNLFYTYIQFKLLINILINILMFRRKILIIKEEDLFHFRLNFVSSDLLYFYDKKWIGGCLTNYRIVSRHPKFLELSKSFPTLRNLRFLPSFFFLFNTDVSEYAIFEGYTLGILTSAIASSNCFYYESINYPIVGSVDCYESMYLYLYILKDCVAYAKVQEYVKVFSLNIMKHSRVVKRLVIRALRKGKRKRWRLRKLKAWRLARYERAWTIKRTHLKYCAKRDILKFEILSFGTKLLKLLKRIQNLSLYRVQRFLIKAKVLNLLKSIKKYKLSLKAVNGPQMSRQIIRLKKSKSKKLRRFNKMERRQISEKRKYFFIRRLVTRMKRLRKWRRKATFLLLKKRWQRRGVLDSFKIIRFINRVKKDIKIRKKDKKWIITQIW